MRDTGVKHSGRGKNQCPTQNPRNLVKGFYRQIRSPAKHLIINGCIYSKKYV